MKAPPVGYAVDLLCAARPQAIVVYRTSRKFQDAIVKYRWEVAQMPTGLAAAYLD